MTRRWGGLVVGVALAWALAGCESSTAPSAAPSIPGADRTATILVKATSVHTATGMTLLEGPTFGPDGGLYIVDVTAPAGEPKVLRVDVGSKKVSSVYTDETSAYTSAQFSPKDGRLYLTDFASGAIDSITATGDDPKTFFSGPVDDTPMMPDDAAFDEAGNLFVSDTTGYADPIWQPQGRVVRIDGETAEATVLASGLPAPNGISFDKDFTGLFVSEYTANRIDYLGLDAEKKTVKTAHPAVYVNGGTSQIDSTAVDADGNIYQGVEGQAKIVVYSPHGKLLTTVSVPTGDTGRQSATNVAIAPGTTDAYMTVSGPSGGFVYTFEALARGIRQSNGG